MTAPYASRTFRSANGCRRRRSTITLRFACSIFRQRPELPGMERFGMTPSSLQEKQMGAPSSLDQLQTIVERLAQVWGAGSLARAFIAISFALKASAAPHDRQAKFSK